jgi:hypothetical protein
MSLNPMIFAMVLACETTPVETDTQTVETSTSTVTETGEVDAVVWDQLGAVSSAMNTGVYATTVGAWIVTNDGDVVYVDNSGEMTLAMTVAAPLQAIWGVESGASTSVTVVGESGWVAEIAGTNASSVDLGTANLAAVSGNSTERIAVGWGGAYSNSGDKWVYETLPSGAQINAIYMGDDKVFGVGSEGAIIERTGNGEWFSAFSPTNYDLRAIAGSTDSDIWAVGDFGKILHYDGGTWTVLESEISVTLWGVWVAITGEVFVVGNSGYAARYDGKGGFKELHTGVISNLYGVHGVNAEQVWAVGSQGEVLRLVP